MSLYNILRPTSLKDIVGQDHLLDDNGLFSNMVKSDNYISTIIWGPPGIGKTSLIGALAFEANAEFIKLNATAASVSDLRKAATKAEENSENGHRTFVFVDEIHQWAKNQQNVLLPLVEEGKITLFGATVDKPKFVVNSAVLSRCLVAEIKPLNKVALTKLLVKAVNHYKSLNKKITIESDVIKILLNRCSGDARKLLVAFEAAVVLFVPNGGPVTLDNINTVIPDKHIVFDKSGNEHYDYASAYQNCIQSSDADGAIYWLAQWLISGEDPAYICRRMMVSGFEDAASNLLIPSIVMAAHYTTERVGPPECYIPMATATIAIANSERNKTGHDAIKLALSNIQNGETKFVPEQLRAGHGRYVDSVEHIYVKDNLIDKFKSMLNL